MGFSTRVLELVATGEALPVVMDDLCRRVEQIAPDVICSILEVDASGCLRPMAGPSLPKTYSQALDGASIGPAVGSCGTAAWRGEPVEVVDIETDPLWVDYKALALPIGLRACWSSPIKARDGRVIGTFAFYYRQKRGASDLDREIVSTCVHLCAIAIEHDMARRQIQRIAYLDSITGLMNRFAFHEKAKRLIGAATKARPVAVHYLDLDQFKGVNDTLGHRTGDLLLAAIAERLIASIGSSVAIARLGGDEFAVLQQVGAGSSVADISAHVLSIFDRPFEVEDHSISMDASIGVAVAPDDGETVTDLMMNADLALYAAKADGRGRYRFFSGELADAAKARRALEQDLKLALAADQFSVVYQPIVSLEDGAVRSCEALLRWTHPERGSVAPADFIQLAEEMGLITRIGDWVLRQAARQAVIWPDEVTLSVNFSPLQLRNPDLVADIGNALKETGLRPERLIVEITETAILTDEDAGRGALTRLANMGIGLALDDFGTGYSSLRSLRTFPISKIKIDQSFVREVTRTKLSRSIVNTVIALARDLSMTTTAEGIETAEQARRLADEGCTEGQGYYFARPMGAPDLLEFLKAAQGGRMPLPQAQRRAVAG